ncbi:hypothetical protein AMATHDRAFT_50801 [Amanita thiersii Skay4041]|uniref:Carboxylic ester hydrolase n=1 Tax=Amanita thiersii Skay4041 TaxID=703135 RepID=A0A2A9N812_9AGAR|nr:hypothetical protein AMATHDRAFT_50801 [Amanita thiersii Skay4041]
MRGIVIALVSLVYCSLVAAQTDRPVVDLGYAKYAGVVDTTTHSTRFLGIRYAAPPTGALLHCTLRWRAPRQPASIAGVQSADTLPNPCFAAGAGTASTGPFRNGSFPTSQHKSNERRAFEPSEDCLFLDVYTTGTLKSTHTSNPMPVIVWFHGGGYVSGSAAGYNGDDLISDARGKVVVVVIQYRLGVFGFLPGTKVKKEGELNAGLLDQQFALRWVHKHIHKFGGDPRRVTIWGESAGAGSVLQQVIAEGGNTIPQLFRSAIAIYNEVVSLTGCSSSSGDENTLACLREVGAGTLENANLQIEQSAFSGVVTFVPCVDGLFIRQRPTEAFKQRRVNGEALLAVTNTNEGDSFVNHNIVDAMSTADYIAQLFPHFGQAEIDRAVRQYAGLGTNIERAAAIFGEAILICPSYLLLQASGNKAYKGQFAIPPALHSRDLLYYFRSRNPSGHPPFDNVDFRTAFAQSFINFVISLDPNVKIEPTNITPQWSPWNSGNEMLFNRTEDAMPDIRQIRTSRALLKRCAFWESVGAFSGQ